MGFVYTNLKEKQNVYIRLGDLIISQQLFQLKKIKISLTMEYSWSRMAGNLGIEIRDGIKT